MRATARYLLPGPVSPPPAGPPPGSIFEVGDVLSAQEFGGFHLSADGSLLALARYEYVKSLAARPSRVTVLALDEGDAGGPAPETVVFTGDVDGWSPELRE